MDYLILKEFAFWAKERGFDGECYAYCSVNSPDPIKSIRMVSNDKVGESECACPSFDAFFDWCEDNFGISAEIKKSDATIDDDFEYCFSVQIIRTPLYAMRERYGLSFVKTRREARLIACVEFIKEINQNFTLRNN